MKKIFFISFILAFALAASALAIPVGVTTPSTSGEVISSANPDFAHIIISYTDEWGNTVHVPVIPPDEVPTITVFAEDEFDEPSQRRTGGGSFIPTPGDGVYLGGFEPSQVHVFEFDGTETVTKTRKLIYTIPIIEGTGQSQSSGPTGAFVDRIVTEPGANAARYGIIAIIILVALLFFVIARAGMNLNAKMGLVIIIIVIAAITIPFAVKKGQPTSYVVHDFEPAGGTAEPQMWVPAGSISIAIAALPWPGGVIPPPPFPHALFAPWPMPVYTILLPPAIPPQEICNNKIDDDGDTLIDCCDYEDCAEEPYCQEAGNCDDEIDNDCDSYVDCDDPDCDGDPACAECNDGIDNDDDGYTDYPDDPQCMSPLDDSEAVCEIVDMERANNVFDISDIVNKWNCYVPYPSCECGCTTELCRYVGQEPTVDNVINDLTSLATGGGPVNIVDTCNNGLDEDGDGLVDGDDPDCPI